MTEKQVRDYDKFMLRFPDGMRDAIAERAKMNGRSMNSEIIAAIQTWLDADNLEISPIETMSDLAKKLEIISQQISRLESRMEK